MSVITLSIDGKDVAIEAGSRVLAAASQVGIKIPASVISMGFPKWLPVVMFGRN